LHSNRHLKASEQPHDNLRCDFRWGGKNYLVGLLLELLLEVLKEVGVEVLTAEMSLKRYVSVCFVVVVEVLIFDLRHQQWP
jgi:hypothetical protein